MLRFELLQNVHQNLWDFVKRVFPHNFLTFPCGL
jgi:hypothetical protein